MLPLTLVLTAVVICLFAGYVQLKRIATALEQLSDDVVSHKDQARLAAHALEYMSTDQMDRLVAHAHQMATSLEFIDVNTRSK